MQINIIEESTAKYLVPAGSCEIDNAELFAFLTPFEHAAPVACLCIVHTLGIHDRRGVAPASRSRTSDDV